MVAPIRFELESLSCYLLQGGNIITVGAVRFHLWKCCCSQISLVKEPVESTTLLSEVRRGHRQESVRQCRVVPWPQRLVVAFLQLLVELCCGGIVLRRAPVHLSSVRNASLVSSNCWIICETVSIMATYHVRPYPLPTRSAVLVWDK